MADDLEENIFKRNIPGKYSTWDRDDQSNEMRRSDDDRNTTSDGADESMFNNDGEEEMLALARSLATADIPETIRNNIMAERAGLPSTGVKGVLADYKAHQALIAAQREADTASRQQVLMRMARGHIVAGDELEAVQGSDTAVFDAKNNYDDYDGADSCDDEENEFMRDYRAKRLKELKRISQTRGLPVFGNVRDINSADFLSEIDEEDERVWVVVHIYESSIQTCVRMNNVLEEIAAKMTNIKFLRMKGSSNDIAIDRVALPTLTIYRGGSMHHTIAAICEELRTTYFTVADVEWLLESYIFEES